MNSIENFKTKLIEEMAEQKYRMQNWGPKNMDVERGYLQGVAQAYQMFREEFEGEGF